MPGSRPERGHAAQGGAASTRTAFIPGPRLAGWVERFAASHGDLGYEDHDDGVRLAASDGATALLVAPWPDDGRPGRGSGLVERLASLASQPRTVGLLLVRRGGYGVAVASEGIILAAKTGSKYVQSRTAAGGQSQQRFARRRANQADAWWRPWRNRRGWYLAARPSSTSSRAATAAWPTKSWLCLA